MRAEDLQGCDEETKERMRNVFNEKIKQENMAPESWTKSGVDSDLQKRAMQRDRDMFV